MRPLTCAAVRRRLHAFHDRELDVGNQIAVASHIEWCDTCAGAVAELDLLRTALQAAAPGRAALSDEETAGLGAAVLGRAKAEQEASFPARVRGMFDDMHLVYAGVGATLATVACVVVMLGMMRFATERRPDSLAALLGVLATPVGCQFTDRTDVSTCEARWMERFERANQLAEQDAVFALDSIVTEKGRLADLHRLRASGRAVASGRVKLIEGLLDAVSRSRLDIPPVSVPAASNLIWMVERTTVRRNKA